MKLLLFINNAFSLNQYGSSEPVYFVKVEAKGICKEIMAGACNHALNSVENIFG